MKKAFSILLLISLAHLTSCSRGFVYKVFNNSGNNLIVVCYDDALKSKEYLIKSGDSGDVRFPSKLVIRHDPGEWNCDLMPHTRVYEYARAFGPRVQDIQIETDGAIYLLPPKTKRAVKDFPPQSDGYPLRPVKN